MEEERIAHVAFRFVEPEGYRVLAATDVAGGPTPSGDILAHFFVQHASLPEGTVVHEILADGSLGPAAEDTGESTSPPVVDRRLQVGLLLSPDAAERMGRWLLAQADSRRGVAGGEPNGDT